MRNAWKLPTPQLIISVTGGADIFKLSTLRVRRAFQQGLIIAAVTTGQHNCFSFTMSFISFIVEKIVDAWIITGGTNAGIMKEVGDAVDKLRYKNTKIPSKVQCIGICSWNYIRSMLSLFSQKVNKPNSMAHLLQIMNILKHRSHRLIHKINFY